MPTEALRLDPADDGVRVYLARTQAFLGEPQDARITLGGSGPENRSAYVQVWRAHLRIAATGGERAGADQLVRTARQSLASSGSRDPDAPYHLASLLLSLGDRAGAVEALRRAVRTPSPSLIWLPTDPMWDSVRSVPAFDRLVRRIEAGRRTP